MIDEIIKKTKMMIYKKIKMRNEELKKEKRHKQRKKHFLYIKF